MVTLAAVLTSPPATGTGAPAEASAAMRNIGIVGVGPDAASMMTRLERQQRRDWHQCQLYRP